MARICGICKKSPRESDPMDQPIRLHPDDIVGAVDCNGDPVQPGLQACCSDCKEHYRPIIHNRLLENPPLDAQGWRRQTVPAALEDFDGNWLM